MTQRGKIAWLPGRQETLFPDTGGLQGGGGETLEERTAPLYIAVWHWPNGTPGGPTEPEVFWTYWLNDEVVNAEVARLEGLHPGFR